MTAYPSLDEYVHTHTDPTKSEFLCAFKSGGIGGVSAPLVAGYPNSLWLHDGMPSGGAVPPVGGAYPNGSTVGGLRPPVAEGGKQRWLDFLSICANGVAEYVLIDRLYHCSGLSGIVTGQQTVPVPGAGAMRHATGEGTHVWVEIYSDLGTTATATLTMTYTNQDGVSGRVSPAQSIGGTNLRERGRCIMMPLAVGDSGVRSVQSVGFLVSTGTAGDFGITIARMLPAMNVAGVGIAATRHWMDGPVCDVTDACLALLATPIGAVAHIPTVMHVTSEY